jgi:hypothetical protein
LNDSDLGEQSVPYNNDMQMRFRLDPNKFALTGFHESQSFAQGRIESDPNSETPTAEDFPRDHSSSSL